MAKITDYPSITTIDANTILLADGSSGTGKILASDMAKYALETYAGSTLAGSAQSVKSAFNSVNGNNVYVNSIATLNDALSAVQAPKGILVQAYSNAVVNVLAGKTLSGKNNVKAWFSRQSSTAYMYTMNVMDTEYTYTGVYNPTTSTASKIVKEPTRAEVDALNSNLIVPNNRIVILNNSDINTYTTPGVYAVPSDASASTMTNLPRNASGKLIVMVRGNNPAYLQQKYITSSSAYIEYVRNYNNGTWTAWEQLPTRAEIDALNSKTILEAIPLTANSDVLTISAANTYAIGSLIVFSGWFMCKSDAEIPQGTTLFTIGGNKLFQTRYYMPLYNGQNNFIAGLECRENTNIVRARAGFTPVSSIYYYLSGACCIKSN